MEVRMLLLRMLLQPLVLHQVMHQVLAPPARAGPMGSGPISSASQSGSTVPGTALLPRVLSKQALGSGGDTRIRVAWQHCDWASMIWGRIFGCDANRIVAFDAVDSAGAL